MSFPSEGKLNAINPLESRGLLDVMKAYWKSSLNDSLKSQSQKSSEACKSSNLGATATSQNSLLLSLSLSIISDFLIKINLPFTKSAMDDETKALMGQVYKHTEQELISILNINPNRNGCTLSSSNTFNSFLIHLVEQNIKPQFPMTPLNNPPRENCTIQRNDVSNNAISIDEKLKNIDIKYNQKHKQDNFIPIKTYEQRLMKHKRELEHKYKSDLETEIKRFKEMELSQLRIDENLKYMSKLEKLREEYETEFQKKCESVERIANDYTKKLKDKEKEFEQSLYAQRQKYEKEQNAIKAKEGELNRRLENEIKAVALEKERLRRKENEVEYMYKTGSHQINEEISQFKADYDRWFTEEKENFMWMRKEFEESNQSQLEIINKYNAVEKERKELKVNLEKISEELRNVSTLYNNSMKDIDNLRAKISEMTVQEAVQREKYQNDLNTLNSLIQAQMIKEKEERNTEELNVEKDDRDSVIKDLTERIKEWSITNAKLREVNDINMKKIKWNNRREGLNTWKNKQKDNDWVNQNSANNNEQIKQKPNNVDLLKTIGYHQQISSVSGLGMKTNQYCDRREVLAKWEEEQMKLNNQISNEFKNITSTTPSILPYSKEDIQTEQQRLYYNNVVLKEENERTWYKKNKEHDHDKSLGLCINTITHRKVSPTNKTITPGSDVAKAEGDDISSHFNSLKTETPNALQSGLPRIDYTNTKGTDIEVSEQMKNAKNNESCSSIQKPRRNSQSHDSIDAFGGSSGHNAQTKTLATPKIITEGFQWPTTIQPHSIENSLPNCENPNTENERASDIWESGMNNEKSNSKPKSLSTNKSNPLNNTGSTPTGNPKYQSNSIQTTQNKNNPSIKHPTEDTNTSFTKNNNKYPCIDSQNTSYPPIHMDQSGEKQEQERCSLAHASKFNNLDYDKHDNLKHSNEKNDNNEFEEALVEDADLDENKEKGSLTQQGMNAIKGLDNVSISSIHNINSGNIDKYAQSRPNNIDHLIEEQWSLEKSNSKRNSSGKPSRKEESLSGMHQDYGKDKGSSNNNNNNNNNNFTSSSGYQFGSSEIQEDINPEDDDAYNPY